jgi:hypothetical protein
MWFAGMNAGLVICLCAQLLPVFVFFLKKEKQMLARRFCWDDRRQTRGVTVVSESAKRSSS